MKNSQKRVAPQMCRTARGANLNHVKYPTNAKQKPKTATNANPAHSRLGAKTNARTTKFKNVRATNEPRTRTPILALSAVMTTNPSYFPSSACWNSGRLWNGWNRASAAATLAKSDAAGSFFKRSLLSRTALPRAAIASGLPNMLRTTARS
jgi:hypothetical protein